MKFGVIHYNLNQFSFEEFLKYASEAGFQTVELQIRDVWTDEIADPEKKAEEVAKLVKDHGLEVSALSAGNDFVVLDPEVVKAQVERMKRICDLALILGTNIIRTEGGQPKDSVKPEQYADAIAGCVEKCIPFLEEKNVKFAIDNHGLVTNDHEIQLAVFKKVDSEHVGANLDTMNYRWFGHPVEKLREIYDAIAPYTFHTHMKDGTGSRGEYVGAALGEGEIPLDYAVSVLKAAGYDGVYCAEYEGREATDIGYKKCLDWMKANIK